MTERDDELTDAVRELTRTVDELRQELRAANRRPGVRNRPPFPRPPSPTELLRMTDEVAIPALLAGLEASVRALEAFQRGIRLVRTERQVRERTAETTDDVTERASALRRTTLAQLDTVLEELQRAASDGALSTDEGARDLLAEARELRDDVDRRLRKVTDDLDRSERTGTETRIEIDVERPDERTGGENAADDDAPTEEERSSNAAVDVDAELETLKDQYAPEDDSANADDSDSDSDEDRSDDRSDGDDGSDGGSNTGDENDGTDNDNDENSG